MPNYRYNTPEYAHRGGVNGRTNARTASTSSCQTAADRNMMSRSSRQSVQDSSCCEDRSRYDALSGMPLAMAYVPWQEWYAIFDVEKGFQCGTIFEKLNKPFRGTGGSC